MSHTYRPFPTGTSNVDLELHRLQLALNSAQPESYYTYLHAEPAKMKAGMVVLADGTDWNPGSGAGPYRRDEANASWVFIGGSSGAGSGDVVGPASSVNNRVVFFDGVTGKLIKDSGLTLSGSNTGDQTSIVGISGTKAQFDTACSDGNFLYVGDVTQYTDELAQDAVGAMVDSSLVYVDATPLLQRAALTGAITAAAGSNTTALGSFTTAQLNTALSDNDIATGGGTATGTNTGDQTITLTGDVTGSGTGSFAATIAAGAVTLAKQANLAANSIVGNNTGAPATPLALTTAQVKTMLALTSSDVGLGSVTNDAQTKAAIVPNTAPSSGQILVGNAGGTAYAPVAMSGDATLASTGVITSTGKRRLANVTLGSAGTSLASGTITACQFLEIHIYIEGYSGSDTASLRFNADSGGNYRYRWLTSAAGGTTFAAGLVAASTSGVKVAAANTTNSRRIVCHVSNDSSVTEKLVQFESVFGTGSAGTQTTIDLGNGAWISGAATQITSVSLVSSSNMLAGTQMTIYGWN